PAGAGHRIVAVELAGADLDQERLVLVELGREAELPGQDDGLFFLVVEQDAGAIAAVIRLAQLGLQLAIAAAELEGPAHQPAPTLRQQFAADDLHTLTHLPTP